MEDFSCTSPSSPKITNRRVFSGDLRLQIPRKRRISKREDIQAERGAKLIPWKRRRIRRLGFNQGRMFILHVDGRAIKYNHRTCRVFFLFFSPRVAAACSDRMRTVQHTYTPFSPSGARVDSFSLSRIESSRWWRSSFWREDEGAREGCPGNDRGFLDVGCPGNL